MLSSKDSMCNLRSNLYLRTKSRNLTANPKSNVVYIVWVPRNRHTDRAKKETCDCTYSMPASLLKSGLSFRLYLVALDASLDLEIPVRSQPHDAVLSQTHEKQGHNLTCQRDVEQQNIQPKKEDEPIQRPCNPRFVAGWNANVMPIGKART
jgi:hypothetical protein